jgi:hypothetical protein
MLDYELQAPLLKDEPQVPPRGVNITIDTKLTPPVVLNSSQRLSTAQQVSSFTKPKDSADRTTMPKKLVMYSKRDWCIPSKITKKAVIWAANL